MVNLLSKWRLKCHGLRAGGGQKTQHDPSKNATQKNAKKRKKTQINAKKRNFSINSLYNLQISNIFLTFPKISPNCPNNCTKWCKYLLPRCEYTKNDIALHLYMFCHTIFKDSLTFSQGNSLWNWNFRNFHTTRKKTQVLFSRTG